MDLPCRPVRTGYCLLVTLPHPKDLADAFFFDDPIDQAVLNINSGSMRPAGTTGVWAQTGGLPIAYFTADTTSLNFPLANCITSSGCAPNGADDAFVAEYTLTGGPIQVFSTYLGGPSNDAGLRHRAWAAG
jgi:hypothetical protein